MPNPKRRHSKSRRDQRRAHDAIPAPQTVACSHCGEPHMPHRMCPSCGFYKGKLVKKMDEEA
jgi:large subunit ribosomal protein L32